MVLGLLLSWNAYADEKYDKYLIEKKDNSDYLYYNLIIKDYNQHIVDTYTINNCRNLPKSDQYLLDITDCSYSSTKKNLRRNNLNINEDIIQAEHEWYMAVFDRAKAFHKKWILNRPSDEEYKKDIKDFNKFWLSQTIETNFYTKDVWTKYALKKNRELLAEDQGFNIVDTNITDKEWTSNYWSITYYHSSASRVECTAFNSNNKAVAGGSGTFVGNVATVILKFPKKYAGKDQDLKCKAQ